MADYEQQLVLRYSEWNNTHFFHSTRGLKKGDPLSPALYILGAEVLSWMLNSLHQIQGYEGFHMQPMGPQINHLSIADGVIIFASSDRFSLHIIMPIHQYLKNPFHNFEKYPNPHYSVDHWFYSKREPYHLAWLSSLHRSANNYLLF